jgi:thiol-disulfide isomerase/thioredoxin/tRNA A-37 threonylcarbamoyl transferase component Bud32
LSNGEEIMGDAHTQVALDDQRLVEILAAYQAACAAGTGPDPEGLAAKHPELADVLRALFAAAQRAARKTHDTPRMAASDTADDATVASADEPCEALHSYEAATLCPDEDGAVAASHPNHFGDYVLLEEIARGGMGIVFRARQRSLHRIVALKMILAGQLASREQVRRFHIEAEQGGTLDHPNIVPIYHVGEEHGQHYFTMKLIEGGSLRDHVAYFRDHPRAAAELVVKVARAVHYAHQRGVLHRDLKPGNILVDAQGEPHVTDFGLAKHLGGDEASTASGAIVGTPSYMAPEQAACSKHLTTGADVYSVGAVLYELLTGRPPFIGPGAFDIIQQVMETEPTPPRSINTHLRRDLETICLTCLAKEPERRYASADALAKDLERYLAGEPIRARPVGRIERTLKWIRRRPAAAALLAVSTAAVLALSIGGWWYNVRLQSALATAETNEREAEHQSALARRQSQLVNQGFQDRLANVDEFMIRMDGRLANIPGLASIRVEFLQEFLQWSRNLLREQKRDESARRMTSLLLRRMGDVCSDNHMFAEGERAYGEAVGLLKELTIEFADKPEYRNELAITHAHQARLLRARNRSEQALATFRQSISALDDLSHDFPAQPQYVEYAAFYRFDLANLLEETGKRREADPIYRQALEQQIKLTEKNPGNPTYQNDLALTAGSLALLLSDSDRVEARRQYERALQARRQQRKLQAPQMLFPPLQDAYTDLGYFFKRTGQHAEMMNLAHELRRDFPNQNLETYNAACFAANAIEAVQKAPKLADEERRRLIEDYGRQAVALLDKATKEGWSDREQMNKDPDLHPLRARPDFQELLVGLDKRSGAALTPEKQFSALRDGYENDRNGYLALQQRARTIADRKRAELQKPRFEDFAGRCLALAEKHPESPAAVDALAWILENCEPADQRRSAVKPLWERALVMLERDHLQKAELGNVCQRLADKTEPGIEKLLRAAMEKHSMPEVRGLAGYALGMALAKQAENYQQRNPAKAAELAQRAEKQIEQVVGQYASVPYGNTTLDAAAKEKLYELRYLSIGRVAADIDAEDFTGQKFKLSDYRGKVVVVDFWANWCGYCRQMYPQERRMVERLKDRPFALLGVNCDDNKSDVLRDIQRQGISWRSWWDGGQGDLRIAKKWQVTAFPTIYVLDHKGIIRYRYTGLCGPELDHAVEELLKECETQLHASR